MIRQHIIYNDYSPWLFDIQKAEGSYIWKSDGAKLIDFSSGWNVVNLGWNHPEIAEAVAKQVKSNVYAPMWTADKTQTEYADQLTAALPAGLEAVGRATGGTEANEMALKIARAKTGRSKIVGIKNSYHGQSFGTLAVGTQEESAKDIAPLVPNFVQLDYPSSDRSQLTQEETFAKFKETLETTLAGGDVAAVITEAGIITGWGSVSIAPAGYLKLVRELTQKHGALLILDEVGTGFSRCGKLFGLELENVVPDIVTLAKAISNGAGVIAASVTTNEIADATFAKAHLTSTFGWTPLACAAAQKTLEIHQRDRVWEKAEADGKYMLARLRDELATHPSIKDIRGIGMELGVETKTNTGNKIVKTALSNGLHLAETDGRTIQIMPPLNIDRSTLDEGIAILIESARKV